MRTEDDVKYITQIDDYKRELLMEVQNRIRYYCGAKFICCMQKCVLEDESIFENWEILREDIDEIFSEFIDMFDGFCWYEDGKNCKVDIMECWWEPGWKEPRIRILDTILRTW